MLKTLQRMSAGHFYQTCFAVLFFLVSGYALKAQVAGDPQMESSPDKSIIIEKSSTKISEKLRYAGINTSARYVQKQKPSWQSSGINFLQYRENGKAVLVDIVAIGDVNVLKSQLEAKGMKVYAVYGKVISGTFPVQKISELENMKGLGFARPSIKPQKQVGVVTSEGDKAQRSDIARLKSGADGLGVKVGVLSDSYDNLKGAGMGVKTGDLPGIGNPDKWFHPVQVLSDLDSTGTDEGRAMLEIVHDVAPGSDLAFHTAFNGEADFAQGIIDLADAGCQVIVDDIIYYDEPFFQDGIIAQAVDQVRSKGVTYFSSAGNESVRSYESAYRPSNVFPLDSTFGTAHNFSDPDSTPRYFQPVYIPKGSQFILSLQWDNSFLSASGVGAEADFDIYLLNNKGQIVAGSADPNIGLDPIEIFGYVNNTSSPTFYLVIAKYAGPDPTRLKYILYGDGAFYLTKPRIPGILSPTLIGHAKAAGAIATGAAFYQDTPAFGVNPPIIESFSSKGGVANYFDIKGNRLSQPIVRKKPEITAPDGGNTSFFYADSQSDPDTFPNFFGTSAAAPHAAGVAAIMIEASKIDLGKFNFLRPFIISNAMTKTAVDMDDPGLPIAGFESPGFDKGFDFQTGFGLLNAESAVDLVTLKPYYVFPLYLSAECSDEPATTRKWKITNFNFINIRVNWQLEGTDQSGVLIAGPGETYFVTSTAPGKNSVIISWKDAQNKVRDFKKASIETRCKSNHIASKTSNKRSIGEDVVKSDLPFIQVYPNPSSDRFQIQFAPIGEGNISLQLYNMQGGIIHEHHIKPENAYYELNASHLPSGMYMLKAFQNGKTEIVKIIKQ